jgi:glycosyltransferase involved in cell wall biosynthesis
VPNGVDVERYYPELPDATPLRHPAVVFTGKMDFRPNVDAMVWFYDHVWPLLKAAVSDVHLYVVGKSPHARLSSLADDPDVTVTGYVVDILPYFGGADVYVVPLRVGGGTRLKVLEAMAAGLPLVSTTLGAEGISLVSGTHALLADTPSAFAQAVCSLLRDPTKRRSLGNAAREFVLQHYDWCQIVPRLYPLYDALMVQETASPSV